MNKHKWFDPTIRIGDIVTLVAVLVAIAATIPQWWSVRLTQDGLNLQLKGVEKIAETLHQEQSTRQQNEAYLAERTLAHAKDLLQFSTTQIGITNTSDANSAMLIELLGKCMYAAAIPEDPTPESQEVRRAVRAVSAAVIDISYNRANDAAFDQDVCNRWQAELQSISITQLGEGEYFRRSNQIAERYSAEMKRKGDESYAAARLTATRLESAVKTLDETIKRAKQP